ncbi:MAG: hypothetical protein JW940_27805 [Polyangiaceae bacterium]|nr:hypothetical protein [Polyangiaceae bacterium]
MPARRHRSSFVSTLALDLVGLGALPVAACDRDAEALVARPLPNGFTRVDDSPLLDSGAPFVGIIVPQTHAAEFAVTHARAQSYWTPAVSDVLELGRTLRGQLRRHDPDVASRLAEYRFQVVGVVRTGRRLLFVNGFCSQPADWHERPVRVKDGGDCYFRLMFEPSSGAISEFSVNGES